MAMAAEPSDISIANFHFKTSQFAFDDIQNAMSSILKLIKTLDADIVCIQGLYDRDAVHHFMNNLPEKYAYVSYNNIFKFWGFDRKSGLVTISSLPIVKTKLVAVNSLYSLGNVPSILFTEHTTRDGVNFSIYNYIGRDVGYVHYDFVQLFACLANTIAMTNNNNPVFILGWGRKYDKTMFHQWWKESRTMNDPHEMVIGECGKKVIKHDAAPVGSHDVTPCNLAIVAPSHIAQCSKTVEFLHDMRPLVKKSFAVTITKNINVQVEDAHKQDIC
jgi:hypothetical protein